MKNKDSMRRKIVSKKNIKKGQKLKKKDLIYVRSIDDGIHVSDIDIYLGKVLKKDKEKYSNFLKSDFLK